MSDTADLLFEESIKSVYAELSEQEKKNLPSVEISDRVHTRYREYLLEADQHLGAQQ